VPGRGADGGGGRRERKLSLSPFLAAMALEAGIFLLRRHQGTLLE